MRDWRGVVWRGLTARRGVHGGGGRGGHTWGVGVGGGRIGVRGGRAGVRGGWLGIWGVWVGIWGERG